MERCCDISRGGEQLGDAEEDVALAAVYDSSCRKSSCSPFDVGGESILKLVFGLSFVTMLYSPFDIHPPSYCRNSSK